MLLVMAEHQSNTTWTNWSGKLSASPREIVQVGTIEAIRAELSAASKGGWSVRTAGTPSDGLVMA